MSVTALSARLSDTLIAMTNIVNWLPFDCVSNIRSMTGLVSEFRTPFSTGQVYPRIGQKNCALSIGCSSLEEAGKKLRFCLSVGIASIDLQAKFV